MLETFLSGASFTDMLARMSTQLDAAEQDKALAAADRRGPRDAARAPRDGRGDPGADQHAAPGDRGPEAEARPAARRAQEGAGAAQEAREGREGGARRAEAPRTSSSPPTRRPSSARSSRPRRPSASSRSGSTGSWRASTTWATSRPSSTGRCAGRCRARCPGSYGCSTYALYPPGNGCDHFHNGIDIVAPYGTPVRASAAGSVVYIGWNYADGADPAWIVIVAHSTNLQTWYAHMQPRYPVRAGPGGQEGPGHRLRGQHRPLDRRAPALDGRATTGAS